jgi:hypothetical protein
MLGSSQALNADTLDSTVLARGIAADTLRYDEAPATV